MREYRGYGINYCVKSTGVYSALKKTMKATLCHDNGRLVLDERPPARMRSIIADNTLASQKTSEEVAYYKLRHGIRAGFYDKNMLAVSGLVEDADDTLSSGL